MRFTSLTILGTLAAAVSAQCQTRSGAAATPRPVASVFGGNLASSLAQADTAPISTYYFPHLAIGGGWQTTITYVNYSPQSVSCQTQFLSDSGAPLLVPFDSAPTSTRTDLLPPGASIHQQTQSDVNATAVTGWAQTQCTGPVKATVLFRFFSQGVPVGEGSVTASTVPTTKFVTFAETRTGVAYANPSATAANVTITALDNTGQPLNSAGVTLQPGAHSAANLGPLLGLSSFTGSVQITASAPIVSLSLNAEAFPVFSALPPGDLDPATPLSLGQ